MQNQPPAPDFRVTLTAHEIRLLDGKCSPKVQAGIDILKTADDICERRGIPLAWGYFVARAVHEARTSGKLICRPVSMKSCPVTGRLARLAEPRRKTRDNPYKMPVEVPFPGFELADRRVIMEGYPALGCSAEALEALRPVLVAELADVAAELPERLTGIPPRFVHEETMRCRHCGWTGRDSITRWANGPHGNRQCPGCGHKSNWTTSDYDVAVGFEVITVEQAATEREEAELRRSPWRREIRPAAPAR